MGKTDNIWKWATTILGAALLSVLTILYGLNASVVAKTEDTVVTHGEKISALETYRVSDQGFTQQMMDQLEKQTEATQRLTVAVARLEEKLNK